MGRPMVKLVTMSTSFGQQTAWGYFKISLMVNSMALFQGGGGGESGGVGVLPSKLSACMLFIFKTISQWSLISLVLVAIGDSITHLLVVVSGTVAFAEASTHLLDVECSCYFLYKHHLVPVPCCVAGRQLSVKFNQGSHDG